MAIIKYPGAMVKAGVDILACTSGKERFVVDKGQKGQEEERGHGSGMQHSGESQEHVNVQLLL